MKYGAFLFPIIRSRMIEIVATGIVLKRVITGVTNEENHSKRYDIKAKINAKTTLTINTTTNLMIVFKILRYVDPSFKRLIKLSHTLLKEGMMISLLTIIEAKTQTKIMNKIPRI